MTKSTLRPQVWSISEAERAPGAKSERPARIRNKLAVAGTGERGLALLADAQRGLAHRSQILMAGIGAGSIRHRVATGSLHPVLPSVLAVGHGALEPLAAEVAALLYAGDDSVLSHATVATLWELAPARDEHTSVTVVGRKCRHRPGVRIHRVQAIDIRDVTFRHGLPVTAPARTLIDFAAEASVSAVEAALNEARVLGLVDDRQLHEAMERCPGRTGVGRLRGLLAAERGPALTRSQLERRLRALVEQGELPRPQFNVWLHGYLVDALWPAARVVVELDGFATHGHRAAFERDRRRDQRLAAEGYIVLRVTDRQLREEPLAVVARLARALAIAEGRWAAG